jgi:signal transduction histidine kinase
MTDTNTFMTMVVNRAIDYTKCSSGYTLTPNLLTINITETIEWAIRIVSGKSRVPIVFEPLPSNICSHIITDRQWLIENILCLVSNATKFTMHGLVTVRYSLTNENTSLLIEVEDTGIGVAPEDQDRIFERFIKGDASTRRRQSGAGLGLSISKALVLSMGGCLSLQRLAKCYKKAAMADVPQCAP